MSDGRFRDESNCLGLGVLAETEDAEGEEPSATDLTADPPNVGVFLGLLLTPVMLLRLPWSTHEPIILSVQRDRSRTEKLTIVRAGPCERLSRRPRSSYG